MPCQFPIADRRKLISSVMSTIYKRGNADVQANLTPMIDVTFLLIVFFVLVSQIVEVEHVDMDLPRPLHAASHTSGEESRTVINIMPGPDGRAAGYRVGAREFPADEIGIAGLQQRVTELYSANPNLRINLRADRNTQYQWVEPVMQAITDAARQSGRADAVARVNLVVVREN